MPATGPVLSHWYKLVNGLHASTRDFYAEVDRALHREKIPLDREPEGVVFKQSGAFSHGREYLRIRRGQFVFDLCGAPFGNGYFFSWWLTRRVPGWGALFMCALFIAFVGVWVLLVKYLPVLLAKIGIAFLGTPVIVLSMVVVVPLCLWLIGRLGAEDLVLATPIFGRIYRWLFNPSTYYKIDLGLMFQAAVHTIVTDAIDELTKTKGLRGLTELERKPILRDLFGK